MPSEVLYAELANFKTDVETLRRFYVETVSAVEPIAYRDGEDNYHGWAISSRDGSLTDGVRKNNKDSTIARATVPTELCTGPMLEVTRQLSALGFQLYRARVFRLASHGRVMSFHTDADYECWRLHIPIISNEGSLFEWELADGTIESRHLPPDGRAWLVRVDQRHRAINTGVGVPDRVHFLSSLKRPPPRSAFGDTRAYVPEPIARQA